MTFPDPAAVQQMQQWMDQHRITEVECLIPDMAGQARGKIVPRHKYNPAVGLRLPTDRPGDTFALVGGRVAYTAA